MTKSTQEPYMPISFRGKFKKRKLKSLHKIKRIKNYVYEDALYDEPWVELVFQERQITQEQENQIFDLLSGFPE